MLVCPGSASAASTGRHSEACAVTAYPKMIGRPHARRSGWPVSSNTAPPPTLKKSPSSHASITRCWNSVSLASRSFRSMVRPLMPPCSLHQLVNASAVSNISWLRPEPAGEARVGERRNLDRLGGDAGVGARGEGFAFGRVLAEHAEVAEGAVVEAQLGFFALAVGRGPFRSLGRFGPGVRFLSRVLTVAATRGDE